jgi:hypothetical protein
MAIHTTGDVFSTVHGRDANIELSEVNKGTDGNLD